MAMCLFITLQSTALFGQTHYPVPSSKSFSITGAPNPCTNCIFDIANPGTVFTIDVPLTLINSIVNVTGNSQLAVNANLILQNSKIIIGDVSSTASTANVFIANNVTIRLSDANSSVRVGNVNNYITGGAGGGGNTPGEIQSLSTFSIFGFTFNTYRTIFSGAGSRTTSPYNLNCGGANPNTCKNGFVYGPVINSQTSIGGFIVFSAFGTDAPLPVVLANFSASLTSNNTVLVSWATEQEVNSSYFAVQRSSNGSDWTTIGTVAAKGNSATVSAYSYTDKSALNGIDYYRLQMVDLDGSYVFSPISVVRTSLVQNISVFPNPARNYINITLGGSSPTVNVRLIDFTGKILQEQRLNASSLNTTISMPVSGYAQGVYILQAIKADGTKWSTKVTIGIGQ